MGTKEIAAQPTVRRIAIMQPYLFPYIGYYQLAAAVDQFLFYDDVQFIVRGYIARNKLQVNGQPWTFSVPLSNASQNKLIEEVRIDLNSWPKWKRKFLRTVDMNYNKARNFENGRMLLEEVLELTDDRIASLAERSVQLVMERLGRTVQFNRTSDLDLRKDLKFEERLIHACQHESATHYIQSQGGTSLYSPHTWRTHGLSLQFIRPASLEYPRQGQWHPSLSMLDALLHVPFMELAPLLDNYELFTTQTAQEQ